MRLFSVIGCGCIALLLTACTKTGRLVSNTKESVPVSFGLSLGGNISSKADLNTITELKPNDATFHGISYVCVQPLKGDAPNGDLLVLPGINGSWDEIASADGFDYHTGLIRNNNAHLYSDTRTAIPTETNGVLVYGKSSAATAASSQEQKHLNGSLVENWSGLTFSPDPIYSEEDAGATAAITEASEAIADILSDIANAYVTQDFIYYLNQDDPNSFQTSFVSVSWSTAFSSTLRTLFSEFTNDGQVTTGAGENISYLLTNLYQNLKSFLFSDEDMTRYQYTIGNNSYDTKLTTSDTPLTYGMLNTLMCNVLLSKFNDARLQGKISIAQDTDVVSLNQDYNSYPMNQGLPSGAALIRWDGNRFQVVTKDNLEGIIPMDKFCYMPPLYYYTKSAIKTAMDKDIYMAYTPDKPIWEDFIGEYYKAGGVVTNQTKSIAIENPLQFACGMLGIKIQAADASLSDNDGSNATNCSATGDNFPVTGLIIGGQCRQNQDFTADDSAPEFYMYDNKVPEGVNLTVAQSSEVRTMVFPTKEQEEIYFFVEFKNNSGKPFYGADGRIMPGCHFYLAGKLVKPSELEKPEGVEVPGSVFASDYFTTVSCTVQTLANAYVSIPELGNPQLSLGLQISDYWIHSPGSFLVLD